MKKTILHPLNYVAAFLLILFATDQAWSQTPIYNDYGNLYLNKSKFNDLRLHDESNIGIVLMAPTNIDLSEIIGDKLYPTDPDDVNRLPETIFPGLRFFKPNRTMTFSFLYARKAYKFDGSGDATLGSTYSNYLEKQSKSLLALRFANDWHFKPNRFKLFDLDHYMGFSVNAGVAPTRKIFEKEFIGGSTENTSVKSNPLAFGGDAYWGANIKFEYFSIGAEFLLFGFDFQRNVGREKVETESSIPGGPSTSNTYYTTDYQGDNSLSGEIFSDLKNSSSQVSLFKGFRLVAVIYLKKPTN